MATALIGFGSNVGNRLDFCDRTLTLLSLLPHSRLDAVSSLYGPSRSTMEPLLARNGF